MSILSFILLFLLVLMVSVLVGLNLWTRRLGRDVEALVPMPGRLQPVRGGKLHFVEAGPNSAQPVVMIHGLSGQLQHMTYALSGLLSDEYRVIAVDRPGCGYSERDNDDLAALPEQARMIWELLDHLGVSNPVLVGHSLGGAISLAMALQRPDSTGALALLCPLTQEQEESPEVFAGLGIENGFLRRLIGHTMAVPMSKLKAEEILEEIFKPDICPDDFLIRAGGALGMRPKAFITASGDVVAVHRGIGPQVQQYATGLRTPGGILYGADDSLLPPAVHGDGMVAHGLVSEHLPGHGHMIPLTAPEACADFVRRMAAMVRPAG